MNAKTEEKKFAGLTADEWRARAKKSRQNSYDSFERSDTDGFLTQWAGDVMASHYQRCAEIAEDDGLILRTALFKDGEIVTDARQVSTRYGLAWVYDDENGNPLWFNLSSSNSPEKCRAYFINKYKGHTLGLVKFKARLNTRTGEPFCDYRSPVEIVTTDDDDFSDGHHSPY